MYMRFFLSMCRTASRLLGGMTEEYALLMRATQAAFLESFPQDIAVWNAAEEEFKKKNSIA